MPERTTSSRTALSRLILFAALGWALGSYQFTRYRNALRKAARLAVSEATAKTVRPIVDATFRVRDLVKYIAGKGL